MMTEHTIRKTFALFTFCLLFIATAVADNYREIKGYVANKDKQIIENALVCLKQGKHVVDSCRSDEEGWWGIHDFKAGSYTLYISAEGYTPSAINISYLDGELWLDTLYLEKKDFSLKGVEIKANRMVIDSDRRIAYPSQHQKERCSDGATLMGMMMFPQITVTRGTREVKYWGSGQLKYYINDDEATYAQVIAIPPKDVVRIEYIDNPPLEYTQGQDVGVVIRYITKKYERGIFNSVMIDKPINRNALDGMVESRVKYFSNEFAFNWEGGYQNSQKSTIFTSNKQIYNLQSGQLRRLERDINDAKGKNFNNKFSFAFFHKKDKDYLAINASYSDNNDPGYNSSSYIFNSGARNDTLINHTSQKGNSQNLSAKIRYRKTLNAKSGYSANLSYAYGMNYSDAVNHYVRHDPKLVRAFGQAPQLPDTTYTLITHPDAHSQRLSGGIGGWLNVGKNWNLSSSLVDYYNYGHIDYTGNYTGVAKNSSNNLSWQSRAGYAKGKFSSNYNFTVANNILKNFSGTTDRLTYINIATNGRYRFTSNSYINYNLYYTPTTPPRSSLSTAEVILNEYQIRRGNTKLKNGHSFQSELTSGFSALNHLNFYIFTTYNYNNNAVRESAIAENDHIVRLPMNFDRHIWKYGAEISLFNINHVYGSFAIGQNRFWSKLKTTGDKFHYVDSYMRLNGTVEIGAWDVSVSWWDHNNDFDGETVFSSGRGLYFTVERAWLDGNLTTSITLSNPFKTNYGREYTKNHSKAAPYTYKMRYPYSHNLLDLTVVFKFAFGKRVSDEEIATGINASSGALNTDSKDNK